MMNLKRAEACGFKCSSCNEHLEKVGTQYGCLNRACFSNHYQMVHRVKLGLISKRRL